MTRLSTPPTEPGPGFNSTSPLSIRIIYSHVTTATNMKTRRRQFDKIRYDLILDLMPGLIIGKLDEDLIKVQALCSGQRFSP